MKPVAGEGVIERSISDVGRSDTVDEWIISPALHCSVIEAIWSLVKADAEAMVGNSMRC